MKCNIGSREDILHHISKAKVADSGSELERPAPLIVKEEHPNIMPDVIDLLTHEDDDSRLSHISIGSVDTDFEVGDVSKDYRILL